MLIFLKLSLSQVSPLSDRSILHVGLCLNYNPTEMIQDAVSSGTGPIFQKVYIKDLPPELLLRVFDIIDIKDCRALGMACRAFHELSLTYVYMVSLPLILTVLSDGESFPDATPYVTCQHTVHHQAI